MHYLKSNFILQITKILIFKQKSSLLIKKLNLIDLSLYMLTVFIYSTVHKHSKLLLGLAMTMKFTYRPRNLIFLIILVLALYAPTKDILHYLSRQMASESIQIVDASFGNTLPWQSSRSGYLTVHQNAQSSLSRAQLIYIKLHFDNPTLEPQSYRKIWLNFAHENGDQEYTTDYVLYNVETRQRLVGKSIELGPESSTTVMAAYRFIPSFKETTPVTMNVSWEKSNLLRESACDYSLANGAENTFHHQCGQ